MPLHLGKSGKTAVNSAGKVEKKFKTKARAKAFLTARNLAYARKRGYKVPKARKN